MRPRQQLRVLTANVNKISSDRKILALLHFLRDCKCDVVFLQEVTAEVVASISRFRVISNVDPETTCGTAILTAPEVEVKDVDILPNGRGTACVIQDILFVNVYAPSGTDNKRLRSAFFSQDICPLFYRNRRRIIFGGDFNCVLRDADQEPRPNKCFELQTFIDTYHLEDTWTSFHPGVQGFTYFYNTGRSRLDRIYISPDLTAQILQADILPTMFSDHCAYICTLHIPYVRPERKYTTWKFNVSHLDDASLLEQVRDLWQQLLPCRRHAASVIEWWLEKAKPAIRNLLINYGREKAHWERTTVAFYRQCLNDLVSKVTTQPELLPSLRRLKAKLLNDLYRKAKGSIVRSRPYDATMEEPLSVYHLKRERQLCGQTFITKWQHTDGSMTTNQRIIQNDMYDHYSQLFRYRAVENPALQQILQYFPCLLTRQERLQLNEPFTVEDVRDALKASPKGKAPGIDGIPVEFYMKFSDLFNDIFVAIVNELHNGATVPEDFLEGLIVLIPKTTATPSNTNMRPITLLNADYKVIARCISNRLKPALKTVVSSEQMCAVPGRNIYDAVLAYRDCIGSVAVRRGITAAIISIDFKNAFDRVSHEYLRKVMTKMGFGFKFTTMIQNILGAATSRIVFNGRPGSSFKISRSVRQGCPLSMGLFILALDPLVRKITAECQGITIGASSLTCRAYADDLGVFIGRPEDIDVLGSVLRQYERASGALVNPTKSVMLPLTTDMGTVTRNWYTIQEKQTILGLQMTANAQQMEALNWRTVLNSVRSLIKDNSRRNLAFAAKTKVINVQILAKAWFLAQVLPVPKKIERAIQHAVHWYLWRGEIFKVSLQTCTLPSDKGGLGLVDFHSKCAALLLHRTNRTMEKDVLNPTSLLFTRYRPVSRRAPLDIRSIPFKVNFVRQYYLHRSYLFDVDVTAEKASGLAAALRGTLPRNKWELRLPRHDWQAVWRNISADFLPDDVKTTWYKVVNRTIATNAKLHAINLIPRSHCDDCLAEDTIEHRFTCPRFQEVWDVSRGMLALMNRTDPREIRPLHVLVPDWRPFPRTKRNADAWISAHTAHAIFSLRLTDKLQFLTYIWDVHGQQQRHPRYRDRFANFLTITIRSAFAKLGFRIDV